MTKFKVGDKVRFVEDYMDYKKGDIVEVEGFWSEGINYIGKGNSTGCYFSRVELVETKPTKNQRITALENEVAELKLIVHELRGKKSIEPSTTNTVEDIIEFEGQQYRKVDREACEGDVVIITKEHESSNAFKINKPYKVLRGIEIRSDHPDHGYATYNVYTNLTDIRTPKTVNVYELIESKPLTPNQQRAAIIEKAKKFVEEKLGREQAVPDSRGSIYGPWYLEDFDFVVNTEKRTIVALCKGTNGKVRERGIAKCDPSDVFNEHIGKAIALGRALSLDVSEFEQAVQPNEVVVGQIVNFYSRWNGRLLDSFEVAKVEKQPGRITTFKNENTNSYFEFEPDKTGDKIINDTNAKYEEGQ